MKAADIKKRFEQEGFECFYQGNSNKSFNIFLISPKGRISIGQYRGDVNKFQICNNSQLYIRETNEFLMKDKESYFNIFGLSGIKGNNEMMITSAIILSVTTDVSRK